ncbi:hypothetical protein FACS1894176_08620 [Bacteroidia bacterium]|nr:hypothetical protein FACS1894176_08620 [Bacteroidia bacterium]
MEKFEIEYIERYVSKIQKDVVFLHSSNGIECRWVDSRVRQHGLLFGKFTKYKMVAEELLTIKEASEWATNHTGKSVTTSNISYLIQYGRIKKIA